MKNLRIPRSEKIGFGVLGALKVISLSAHFCNVTLTKRFFVVRLKSIKGTSAYFFHFIFLN